MTRLEMLKELKSILRETSVDAAWGDTLLLSYMAEGQDKFCEETGYFLDNTTFTITLVEGQKAYALDERIIQVRQVMNGTTQLGKFQESDRTVQDFFAQEFPSENASPYAWQQDQATGYITFYTAPLAADAGTELTLRVWRYPIYRLDNNDVDDAGTNAEPEIPFRFHRAPIHWAAFRALTHHDFEQEDNIKASDHRGIFDDIVRNGRTHFENQHNRRHGISPSPIYTVR
jgi:hypothetical protein